MAINVAQTRAHILSLMENVVARYKILADKVGDPGEVKEILKSESVTRTERELEQDFHSLRLAMRQIGLNFENIRPPPIVAESYRHRDYKQRRKAIHKQRQEWNKILENPNALWALGG